MAWIFFGVLLAITTLIVNFLNSMKRIPLSLPGILFKFFYLISVVMLAIGMFNKVFFYAEPGYVYHVRTILGTEKVIDDTGYNTHLFGRITNWKKAMTVQSSRGAKSEASAAIPPLNIMFLDQVDANCSATARFRIPLDAEIFLKLAHEYRSPENLMRTALIPAFQETLSATSSLMSAEEYYAGGRTEFNNEFRTQIMKGIYIVKRNEKVITTKKKSKGSANASKGKDQEEYGSRNRVIFVVEKVLDENGQPKKKVHNFLQFGVQVVDAMVTDMTPNAKFVERMQLKQKASADRAIAREQRIQEEEQRLLAIAKGEREVAQRQAIWKADQIEKTTKAETTKQLAITEASKKKAQAEIDRDTAKILLEKAEIDSEAIKVKAKAEAYKKKAIIEADNALSQKLNAMIEINNVWAQAYSNRKVPSTVIGGSGNEKLDQNTQIFQQMLNAMIAKQLAFEPSISKKQR
jgi:regulator of protease activity HflC (stomatin/prohibitin superfamily)